MNYVQILIFFQLFPNLTSLLYPCQYIDSNENLLQCNLCKCFSFPSIISSSSFNLCSLTPSLTCTKYVNTEFLNEQINAIDSNLGLTKIQVDFHHFNSDLFTHERFCDMANSSQLTFFNTLYNQTSSCSTTIPSLRFANSIIANPNFLTEKLVFYNSTFDINYLNFTSTKILILHTIKFLIKPFELNSLVSLTHLTIIQSEDYHLTGIFPHLTYLNLHSTNLNDKQLNRLLSQLTLPDLTQMILSKNSLTIISNKFPSTIRYLDLSHNQIKSLDYYSFKSLYSLNILNLSHNSPLEIQQDTFTRIPYLELLDLSHALPTLPFDDLFLPLQKLRYLNISHNTLDSLPQLPIPYDAHMIESDEHHLPILDVDLSQNYLEEFDWQISSTQDKYILSINLKNNRLINLKFPSSNDTKRRGPFIELDLQQNPLQCDCYLYQTIFQVFYRKQTRLKILHLFNLTCFDMLEPIINRSLIELTSSNSFCSDRISCPSTCTCQHSYDLNNNYVNCSHRQLTKIPGNIPDSTTHLYLHNNQIAQISTDTFSNLLSLKQLYLHHNPWLPNFSQGTKEFQSNRHLFLLTYANGSLCNRSRMIEGPLTIEDCCKTCRIIARIENSTSSTNLFLNSIDPKYLLLGFILFLLLLISILILFIYRKKRLLFPNENYYANHSMKQPPTSFNENSFSYTDEDDYASIPLTISQTDLSIPVLQSSSSSNAPPLPPPRYCLSNRPISHTSTASTSITIRSIKGLATTHSCLQIKLDVLVLYSIQDSEYIHDNLGQQLEHMYGKRFSFYFIHRDRMLGELEWLIENSCITILILHKPYHCLQDYMKVLANCSPIKCFIIMIDTETNHCVTSLKIREKIGRLYRTSDIYEWNSNPHALIHEQLELFLEQNCGSATYVTD